MTSFFTTVENELGVVESAVVNGAKAALNYVDGVLVNDLLPELEAALKQALQVFGQEALAGLLNTAVSNQSPTPSTASVDQAQASASQSAS